MAKKDNVMTVLLAVLVLVSAIQAAQLITLSSGLSSGSVSVKTAAKTSAGSTPSGSAPAPVAQNLPSMVGGC